MAKLLKDKGFSTYTTTIHKIENDQRPVPLDEAAAIADLFGMSLDTLLGRNLGPDRDLLYMLTALGRTAQQAAPLMRSVENDLRERVAELGAFEFDQRSAITDVCERTAAALRQANDALAKIWLPLHDGLVEGTADQVLRDQIAELADADG